MTGELSRSAMPGATGVVDEDLEAYETNYQTHRTGISTEECIQCYNKTAKKYEENLNPSRYRGYVIAAEAVETFYGQDKSARVLDVGAGTGFLGKELEKRGYTNIDALEPASEMLRLAAEKGVYRSLYCDVLGGSEVTIPDDTYDVLALSGSMGEGHIQCKGLAEMVRIVKPVRGNIIVSNGDCFLLLSPDQIPILVDD
ncbi:hypothetical protein LSH36_519g03073 [Paralvinella palmiformis]|uniref:Methyltransferase domain-containing protein n=1 Tax=Paralvinella palmiformis TaxID=53620 RepID=A0AAD9MYV4_9ANNE|nr:hypothetical protein LSH36_519g03073 [Paralvinella palmiformis]